MRLHDLAGGLEIRGDQSLMVKVARNKGVRIVKSNSSQSTKEHGMAAVFVFSWKSTLIRSIVLLGIIYLSAHIVVHQVPWHSAYVFPKWTFFYGLLFGIVVCAVSWGISYAMMRWERFTSLSATQQISSFLMVNLLVASAIFTSLFALFFGFEDRLPQFFTLITVCLLLVLLENLAFWLYGYLGTARAQGALKDTNSVLIPVGQKVIRLNYDQISYAAIEDNIISVYTTDNNKLSTQLNSLEELYRELSEGHFYRLNRQTIVHRSAIKEVSKQKNRKLAVRVNGQVQSRDFDVSRYKSKELMEWLKNKHYD